LKNASSLLLFFNFVIKPEYGHEQDKNKNYRDDGIHDQLFSHNIEVRGSKGLHCLQQKKTINSNFTIICQNGTALAVH